MADCSSENVGAVMLMVTQGDVDLFDAARAWINVNQEKVQDWLQ